MNTNTFKSRIKQFRLPLLCIGVSLLFFLAGFFEYTHFLIMAILLASFIALPINEGLCLALFLTPFQSRRLEVYNLSGYSYLILFGAILIKYIYLAKKGKVEFYKNPFILTCVITIIGILASFGSKIAWKNVSYATYLFFFYFVFCFRKEINIHRIMKYFICGIYISCIISLIGWACPHYPFLPFSDEASKRWTFASHNPNRFYPLCVVGATYCIYLFLNEKINTPYFCILIISLLSLGAFTLSKTYVICAGFIMVCFTILCFLKYRKSKLKKFLLVSLCSLAVCLIASKQIMSMFGRLGDNNIDNFVPSPAPNPNPPVTPDDSFSGNEVVSQNKIFAFLESITTNRFSLWVGYILKTFSSTFRALFGCGLFAGVADVTRITNTEHSLFIYLIYRFGIIGICALIWLVFEYKKIIGHKNQIADNFYVFIVFLAICLIDNVFKPYRILLFIVPLFLLFDDRTHAKDFSSFSLPKTKENTTPTT